MRDLTGTELSFLRGVDSPTLANAIEEFGLRDRTEGFVGGAVECRFPDLPPMVGLAQTATFDSQPGEPQGHGMGGHWRLFEALQALPVPTVIAVADGSGQPDRVAYWGDVTTTIAQRLGCVGVVTDGGVRDLAQIRALGGVFQVFAQHVVVSHGNLRVAAVGEPVLLAGQLVRTGDLVHGDANGVVVIPWSVLDDLPGAVERVREREASLMAYARSPEFTIAGARALTGG